MSLAFAAFPELFGAPNHTVAQRVYNALIHLGDPPIQLVTLGGEVGCLMAAATATVSAGSIQLMI